MDWKLRRYLDFINEQLFIIETYGGDYKEWMTELYRNAHYAVFEKIDVEVLMALANEVFDDNYIDLIKTMT